MGAIETERMLMTRSTYLIFPTKMQSESTSEFRWTNVLFAITRGNPRRGDTNQSKATCHVPQTWKCERRLSH